MKAHLVQAIFLCLNLCSLFSACGSGSFAPGIGSASLSSSSSLQSIQVAPSQPSITLGQDQQFTATGHYHDGSSKDITSSVVWASSNTSVAKISGSGFAKSSTMGSATISATLSGVTGDSTLIVTKAILESINIAPANPVLLLGTIQQFTATGTFSDQSQHDITSSVSWVSSNSLASISGGGLAAALALGSLTISASSGSVSASTTVNVQAAVLSSITIHPGNGKVAKWTTQQFNATGTYTDGTTHGVTGQVSWTSSNTAVAKIAKSGLASALTPGTTTITATLGSISASATLKVTNATMVSISVRPSGRTIAPLTTLSFTAVGLFSDNSTQVINRESTWTSDNHKAAKIRAGSTVIAVGQGTANISATFIGVSGSAIGVSGSAPLNISSVTLSSISVTQATAVLAPTTSVNCVATGTFSDGSTQVITNVMNWTSSEPTVASVSNGGKVTANSGGSATITAQFGSVTGDSTITVDPSPVALILISPPTTSIPQQTGVAFQAIATFADGNTQDLTAFAFWTSSLPSVATIDTGHATGLDPGTAIITALFDGQVGTASLTVTSATPTSPVVSPAAISSEQEH